MTPNYSLALKVKCVERARQGQSAKAPRIIAASSLVLSLALRRFAMIYIKLFSRVKSRYLPVQPHCYSGELRLESLLTLVVDPEPCHDYPFLP